MKARERDRLRRRIEAELERDADLPDRQIAIACRCSPHTVARWRNAMRALGESRTTARMHAGVANLTESDAMRGNTRAVRHGLYSPRLLEARADELVRELRSIVPDAKPADEPLIKLLALTLSRIEAGNAWISGRGLIKNERSGEVWPIVKPLASWENSAVRLCSELGLSPVARARLGVARDGHDAYLAYSRIVAANQPNGDAHDD